MSETHVVKINAGSVLLYRSSGNLLRTLCHGATSAVVQAEEVHVTMTTGRVRIYSLNGNLKRTI